MSSAPSMLDTVMEFGADNEVDLQDAFSPNIDDNLSQKRRDKKLRRKGKAKRKTFVFKQEHMKADSQECEIIGHNPPTVV